MRRNKSKQINKNKTGLVRIDAELIRLLKMKAAAEKTTIRALVEEGLAEVLAIKEEENVDDRSD